MSTRILIVEDEENMAHVVKLNLELEGYETVHSADGEAALKRIKNERYDLLILDVMLPKIDGFKVCEHVRQWGIDTPVLFLTAKDTQQDKIQGLRTGGDDYLTKPFDLEELLLRVKNLVKHSKKETRLLKTDNIYSFAGNTINFNSFEATGIGDKKFVLTQREVILLKLLIEHKNQVVSREDILGSAWGYDVFPNTRTIDNFILAFRKYFEEDSRNPQHFHSVRGVGYKFTE